jgi:hypothetical protein
MFASSLPPSACARTGFVFKDSAVRWGIIGVGDVCEVKAGPGLYKVPGSSLVAVMRRDGLKAAEFASRHGVARSYDTVEGLLTDKNVNGSSKPCVAVLVSYTPSSHLLSFRSTTSEFTHTFPPNPPPTPRTTTTLIPFASCVRGLTRGLPPRARAGGVQGWPALLA